MRRPQSWSEWNRRLARPWVKTTLKTLGTLAACFILWTSIDVKLLTGLLQQAWGTDLVLAAVVFAVAKFISAIRLQRFLDIIGFSIRFSQQLKWYSLGMLYNQILPGGIGGDGYKVLMWNRQSDFPAKELLKAVFIDRVNGVVPIGAFLTVGLAVWLAGIVPWSAPVLVLCGVAGVGLSYWLVGRFWPVFSPVWSGTLAMSGLVQAFQCTSVWLIARALGVPDFSMAFLVVFLISSIVAVLPFTIGGIGARELTFLWGAGWVHVPPSQAVAISVLFYLIQVFTSLSGLYFVWKPPVTQLVSDPQTA